MRSPAASTALRASTENKEKISEKLVERYRVRYEPYVTLIPSTPKHIQEAFSLVKGAKKQETLLLAMLELSGAVRGSAVEVSKAALLDRAGATSAILSALVKKGILRVWKKEISRFKFSFMSVPERAKTSYIF